MGATSPPFTPEFLDRLREAAEHAATDARTAADELEAVAEALKAVRKDTQAYTTLIRRARQAAVRYDNLKTRADRLRQLLNSVEA